MKKITSMVLVFLCLSTSAFSQSKIFHNWNFFAEGVTGSITFNNPGNVPSQQSIPDQMLSSYVAITVSDDNGNLLFYSDGDKIFNKYHQVMPNGDFRDVLGPNVITDMTVVPYFDDPNKYYLIWAHGLQTNYPLKGYSYATIDMALDGGNGDLNVSSISSLFDEYGQATGDFYQSSKRLNSYYDPVENVTWVVLLNSVSQKILTYRVDANGVNPNPVNQSPVINLNFSIFYNKGEIRISPDGTRIAMSKDSELSSDNVGAFVGDFDSSTGAVSNLLPIIVDERIDDLEFSPDSQTLYMRGHSVLSKKFGGASEIGSIYSTPLTVSSGLTKGFITTLVYSGMDTGGAIQRGPDDKIYFNNYDSSLSTTQTFVGVINNPNDPPGSLNINSQLFSFPTLFPLINSCLPTIVHAIEPAPQPFVTTWHVDGIDNTITIPTFDGEAYNYNIDWGDGSVDTGILGDISHTYAGGENDYTVKISGTFPRIHFPSSVLANKLKITRVDQWGSVQWNSMEEAFWGCANLEVFDPLSPDLSGVTSLKEMFRDCSSLDQSLDHWDVSTITNMNRMFFGATIFNQSLNSWDVRNVTDMAGMFANTQEFNGLIRDWEVISVTTMDSMFSDADGFNQSLNDWDVSSVTNMAHMFAHTEIFNGSIEDWDVDNVTTMYSMFQEANAFDGVIGGWNVGKVENMARMFFENPAFDQPLNDWNVISVTDMSLMFSESVFNKPINDWDVINVTNMERMFGQAIAFDQPLNSWEVDNVTNMAWMFYGVSSFNRPLNDWIVTNVTNMTSMFNGASSFNQSLDSWDVRNVTTMDGMLNDSGLSNMNYEDTLIGWNNLAIIQNGVELGAAQLAYCSPPSITARQSLINRGWTITGDFLACASSINDEEIIYPNPFDNSLKISQNDNNRISQIILLNSLGNIILRQNPKNFSKAIQLNTSKLDKGIYFVKTIFTNGKTEVRQVIKD